MNKNKLFIFLIGALLVTNIVLIFFLVNGRGPHHGGPPHHRGGPRDLIIERLHFDDKQVEQFEVLIQKHRHDLRENDETLMNIKTTLYSNLKGEENKALNDSLINAMVSVQNKIEHVHYSHFEDVKKLCRPEQIKYFNELATELSHIFGPPPPPPHGPDGPPPHH